MNTILKILFLGVLVISCKTSIRKNNQGEYSSINKERFQDSIAYLDLSYKGLKTMPDLSLKYKYIEKLNLSHNAIKKFKEDYLPANLKELDISNNNLEGYFYIVKKRSLEIVNVSHNKLDSIIFGYHISTFNVSFNNLTHIYFPYYQTRISMGTLDISNNKELDNELRFPPWAFKTIFRDNIKNDKDLIWSLEVPIID